MKFRALLSALAVSASLLVAGFYCVAQAQWSPQVRDAVLFSKRSVGCPQATTFLARTSLAGGDVTNYTNLICGLVTDGLIDGTLSGAAGCGTYFDIIQIYATANTTTALLNLCGTSYSGVATGSPTFTAYRGYNAADAGAQYINPSFNPSTAGGKFTQNSAHMSLWAVNDVTTTSGGVGMGLASADFTTSFTAIYPRFSDGKAYYPINDGPTGSAGVTTAASTGHRLTNRSAVSTQQGYNNAVNQGVTPATASATLLNDNLVFLNLKVVGSPTPGAGYAGQIGMVSVGGSLTASQVATFYNRLRTYMTAVGIP